MGGVIFLPLSYMKLSIYSIQSTLFEGETEKLIAKTAMGEITVLDNHLPLVTILKGPDIEIIDKKGEKNTIPISSGFLEVRPESDVVILAEI